MKVKYTKRDSSLADALADVGNHFRYEDTLNKEQYSLILDGCGVILELKERE